MHVIDTFPAWVAIVVVVVGGAVVVVVVVVGRAVVVVVVEPLNALPWSCPKPLLHVPL